MKRRRYLLLAGSSGLTLAAGCLDGDGEVDDEAENGDDEAEDDNGDEDEQQAADYIEDARGHLDTAAVLIDDEADDDDDEFEVDNIDDALEDATAALDDAETYATDDQLSEIDKLRDVASWLEALADVIRELEEGFGEFDAAFEYYDVGRYGDAEDRLGNALGYFEDAGTKLVIARNEFESVDHETLDSLGNYDAGDAEDVMDDLEEIVDLMEGFTVGFQDMTRGFDHMFKGIDALEEERWNDMKAEMEAASDELSAAEREFRDLEEGSPPDMLGDVLGLVCMAEAFGDAADHYANAAEAAQVGDWNTFDWEAQQADEAMERCE
ncbi:hypothetical protein ACYJ1Y_08295 [Natrialbaceae archaeon A-gly3]